MQKTPLSESTNKVHEINRETVLTLLGGQRALLLQVAHPLVGKGVLDHSSVRSDPLKRLMRTYTMFQTLIFGTQEEIDIVVAKINHAHKFVKGNLDKQAGAHHAGTAYSAHDPKLLLWVWATLVDTHILVFDMFIRHLSEDEKETYYQQSKKILPPLGGRIEDTPPTFKDLHRYMKEMYTNGQVHVTDAIRKEMIPYLLIKKPKRLKFPFLALSLPLEKITTGLLPKEVRAQYRLSWTEFDQKMLDLLAASSRRMYKSRVSRFIPEILRYSPQYRKAYKSKQSQNT